VQRRRFLRCAIHASSSSADAVAATAGDAGINRANPLKAFPLTWYAKSINVHASMSAMEDTCSSEMFEATNVSWNEAFAKTPLATATNDKTPSG